MSLRTINRRAAETREHAQQTRTELKRSAREAGRTLGSAVEMVRVALRDGTYAMLGAGDVAASMVREARDRTMDAPARVLEMVRSTPRRVRHGIEQLRERGERVAARIIRSPAVHQAVVRTRAAQRSTRQAAASVRGAARAQVRGAKPPSLQRARSGAPAPANFRDWRARSRHPPAASFPRLCPETHADPDSVIPAKAGIQASSRHH
jgi:hypothetical protein